MGWTDGIARKCAKDDIPDLDDAIASVRARCGPCVASVDIDRIVVVRMSGVDRVNVYLAGVKSPMGSGDQPLSMKFETPSDKTDDFLAQHFPGVPVKLIDNCHSHVDW